MKNFRFCTAGISPNVYFDKLLFLKVYRISAKKVQRSDISWHWTVKVKCEGKTICCFKNDRNLVNFNLSTQVSNIFTLTGPFRPKDITFDLKKSRGVTYHDNEEWCKIWRKTDLWFEKWHEEFGKVSPEHLEMSKLGLW